MFDDRRDDGELRKQLISSARAILAKPPRIDFRGGCSVYFDVFAVSFREQPL